MSALQAVLFGVLACAVAAAWIVHVLRVARVTVPVVLVKGIDGRTREVPLDELERHPGHRS